MLTPMKIRNADKPIRTSQDMLKTFDKDGGYICTAKLDGWRCIIDWTGTKVGFFSRREADKGGPTILSVNESLQEEVHKFLLSNNIPSCTRLDTEWMCRRTHGPEQIQLIGVQYWDGNWIGNKPEKERWSLVSGFNYTPNVQLIQSTLDNYDQFFNSLMAKDLQKSEDQWWAEGVVLKHQNSKLIGDLKTCRKNPQWFKVKWRDNPSGHDLDTF